MKSRKHATLFSSALVATVLINASCARTPRDDALMWHRRIPFVLKELFEASERYTSLTGSRPSSIVSLFTSRCLDADIALDLGDALDVSVVSTDLWSRCGDIALRDTSGIDVASYPDAVLALAYGPHDEAFIYVITVTGHITLITKREYDVRESLWNDRLGGALSW